MPKAFLKQISLSYGLVYFVMLLISREQQNDVAKRIAYALRCTPRTQGWCSLSRSRSDPHCVRTRTGTGPCNGSWSSHPTPCVWGRMEWRARDESHTRVIPCRRGEYGSIQTAAFCSESGNSPCYYRDRGRHKRWWSLERLSSVYTIRDSKARILFISINIAGIDVSQEIANTEDDEGWLFLFQIVQELIIQSGL